MQTRIIPLLVLSLLAAVSCTPKGRDAAREPSHAGGFYPQDAKELDRVLDLHLSKAEPGIGPAPRAVVVPHAGYVYSGATAAFAYKALEKAKDRIKRVILLAPSHYTLVSGVVLNSRPYLTPLGVYPLDKKAVNILRASEVPWTVNETASTREHSDEVQVPFLQKVLPKARLVPLVVGEMSPGDLAAAAEAVASVADSSTVFVVSCDFTHYGGRYDYQPPFKQGVKEGLRELDGGAIRLILRGDGKGFTDHLEKTGATICGRNPIRLLLEVFRLKGWKADGRMLAYTTSGEITGDWENSVSYAALALGTLKEDAMLQGEKFLDGREEKALLKLARHVLTKYVRENVAKYPEAGLKDVMGMELTEAMKRPSGVFVTLNVDGMLRGCIGSIQPVEPLYKGVIGNAMNAAAQDPRFNPVEPGELEGIEIEISVMSPLLKVGSPDEIVVGRDGVVLRAGGRAGVFLPQVPVEWKWDRKEYLEQLGHKAGLDADAYKRKDAQLWRFTAQVFSEE